MRLRIILVIVSVLLGLTWGYFGMYLSTPDEKTLANLEAILNISANATEIVGIQCGMGFITAAIMLAFLKEWRVMVNLFLGGMGWMVGGLAFPGLVNFGVASLRDGNNMGSGLWMFTAICAIVAMAAVLVSLALLYLPVHIARKRGKTNINAIFTTASLGLLIPILWPVAMLLAYKRPRQN